MKCLTYTVIIKEKEYIIFPSTFIKMSALAAEMYVISVATVAEGFLFLQWYIFISVHINVYPIVRCIAIANNYVLHERYTTNYRNVTLGAVFTQGKFLETNPFRYRI